MSTRLGHQTARHRSREAARARGGARWARVQQGGMHSTCDARFASECSLVQRVLYSNEAAEKAN
jgi:hypothetical protein